MLVWEGLQDIFNKKGKVQNIAYGIDTLCVICFTYSGVCNKFRFVPWKGMQETFRKSFLKSGNAEGSFNFIVNQGPKTQMPKGPE